MIRILSLTAATFVLFTVQAIGQTPGQPVNIRNAGAFTCQEFQPVVRHEQRQLEKTAFLQWTAAYATAAARSNSLIDVFPIGDTWELLAMVNFICDENNTVKFETALLEAIGRLRPFWVRNSPAVTTLEDPNGRSVQFYSEASTALQTALNRFGAGLQVDGAFGNQTANAIRAINQRRGAQPWLTPDGELLYLLTRP
ncbi:peptidoglycan-binding domain-containing protein [Roseinatronobacter monicus]|uniref:Putative peptidoglycan binding protein n=1 Tax=Roseinatronobacter monicus TaxID=393481 RepID=A0A543K4A7_9RHOB|nr:peptidoglycan-binding domain-containing protein [Roseinatronobacter monicus]TQM89906.1 putative peptidoglycan binding protein [Roseinatronobacter monicus]